MSERYLRLYDETDGSYGTMGSQLKDLLFLSADDETTTEFSEFEEANKPFIRDSPRVTQAGNVGVELGGRPDELTYLLAAMFGKPFASEAGASGEAYEYVWFPDRSTIPHSTIVLGKEDSEFEYNGQVFNEFEFSSEVGEYLGCTFGTIGQSGDSDSKYTIVSEGGLSLSDISLFTMNDLKVTIGEIEATALQTANLSISNNLDEDIHVLGDMTLTQPPKVQRREVEMDLDFKHEDESIFQDYLSGTTASVKKEFVGSEIGSTGINRTLDMRLPKLQYRDYEGNISGRDAIRTSTSGTALADEITFANAEMSIISSEQVETAELGIRLISGVDLDWANIW